MANEIYNTTWWGTALDTARTAGTDPDFFGSQMKLLTSEQPELVTNGDFATDSNWTKGTGWTISGGKAIKTSGTGSSLSQTIATTTVGKKYKFTFDAIVTGGVANAELYGVTIPNFTTTGTQEHTITATSTSGFEFYAASNFVGSIDNVSVQIVRADQIEAKKCLADWIHTTALQDLNN